MTNRFPGLHTGPLDHRATSVINAISDSVIQMGATVELVTPLLSEKELLPRVQEDFTGTKGSPLTYGIAVGGDADGIYGFAPAVPDNTELATSGAGQGVKIVTQGRCPALVQGNSSSQVTVQINIGDPLSPQTGRLLLATSGDNVVARALHPVSPGVLTIIAVDFKSEGIL